MNLEISSMIKKKLICVNYENLFQYESVERFPFDLYGRERVE